MYIVKLYFGELWNDLGSDEFDAEFKSSFERRLVDEKRNHCRQVPDDKILQVERDSFHFG